MFVLILMGVVFVIFIIIRIVQKIQDDIYELEYREDTKMYEKLRRDEINSSGVIIDHDDYFEFVHPIGDVHMVAKHGYSQNEESWDYAMWLATRNKSGGFQDWRLPTIEELKKLHENRHVINEILRRGTVP